MKNIFLILIGCFISVLVSAQKPVADPVHWTNKLEKTGEKEYALHLTATMEPGWHIYAQVQPATAISDPTKFVFAKNPLILLTGMPKEVGKKEKYQDKNAGIEQWQYEGTVDFIQSLALRGAGAHTSIAVQVTYQACTGEMCLPPKAVSMNVPL